MPQVEKMPFKTYLAVVENSIDSQMFRHGYAKVDGQESDVMRNGELSCAFYVSSVLAIFSAIDGMHATVASTMQDLENSGWQPVENIEAGDVIVWQPILFPDGGRHAHIGFALSQNEAVSNDYVSGTPQRHGIEVTPDGTKREIQIIYRGKHLFEKTS